jgi:hypothetical protein
VNHRPESRMREIRTYGSEGGATGVITGRSYPYPSHEPYQTLFWTISITIHGDCQNF